MKARGSRVALLLALCVLLGGCAAKKEPELNRYSGAFYDAFDTYISLIGYAETQETFDRLFAQTRELFLRYHEVYDAYSPYEGVHNLYEVNARAGVAPTPAEPELIDILLWLKEEQPRLLNRVNVALGAVLQLWHAYREAGTAVPPMAELRARAEHVNFDDVIIDREAGTVFFADPELSLDLGAVAKGYTVEIAAARLLDSEMPSFIISAGGNVRCGLKPRDGRARWGVGIQDPQTSDIFGGGENKDVLYLTDLSVVTSGDYQRFYEVDGVRYHHLIDPDTLMPASFMRSVTIVTRDSGLADALSTAVFLMPYEQGRAFVEGLEDVEAFWVFADGSVQYTDALAGMLRSQGATPDD